MFESVIGHANLKKLWEESLKSGRVSHAYLLVGPEGVGKRICAKIMAASLVSAAGSEEFELALNNGNPDVMFIEPDGNAIKIDQVREAGAFLRIAPVMSERKVVVFDDAHAFNVNSANALLRILEEPPANRHLFLITDKPYLLPATVRSRCQRFVFTALDDAEVERALMERGWSAGDSKKASEFAEGSLGRALMMDVDILNDVEGFLNDPAKNMGELLQKAEEWSRDVERGEKALLILGTACRRCWRDSSGCADFRWLGCWNSVSEAYSWWRTSANKRLLFEKLLFDMKRVMEAADGR